MAVKRIITSIKEAHEKKKLEKWLKEAPENVKLLNAQSTAMSAQYDFLEECLVDMAMIVYAE